jgi:hypothetical protein
MWLLLSETRLGFNGGLTIRGVSSTQLGTPHLRADSLIKEAKPKAFQEHSTHQNLIRSREALNKFHP